MKLEKIAADLASFALAPEDVWKAPGLRTLGAEGRAWALATLARWTPAVPQPQPKRGGSVRYALRSVDQELTDLAFFALVRAKEPIRPEWDVLLPLHHATPSDITLECAAALTPERVEAAFVAAAPEIWGPGRIRLGTALLEKYDSAAIAKIVVDTTEASTPGNRKLERAALTTIGERQPNVRAVMDAVRKGEPMPITLKVLARSHPRTARELTRSQAAQLAVAGKARNGKAVPIERLLSLDENDEMAMGAVLEHVAIADEAGKHAYDGWLHDGDAGTFFFAGKTTVVAGRSQGQTKLEGALAKKGPAIRDALARIAFSPAAVRAASDVKAATRPLGSGGATVAKLRTTKSPARKAVAKMRTSKKSAPRARRSK